MTQPSADPAHTPPPEAEPTHFGFSTVDAGEKTGRVRQIFQRVAGRYDLMNDLMSGGIHRLWKARFLDRLAPRAGWRVLDVAGGTGDIALRIKQRAPRASVLVCDLTPEMLVVGRDRALDRGLPQTEGGLRWVAGDAEALPLPDRSCDAYTIAFGLRNVARPAQALAEARRVLKPGGRFLCLEFSQVALPALARLYDLYSFSVLPWLGEAVAGDRASYRYLVESIRRFPSQAELAAMMGAAGLARVDYENLSGGIAAIHGGWRI